MDHLDMQLLVEYIDKRIEAKAAQQHMSRMAAHDESVNLMHNLCHFLNINPEHVKVPPPHMP